jgi:hypothetical protein
MNETIDVTTSKEIVEEISTHILCPAHFFFGNRAVYEIMFKILYGGAGQRWQYGTCALHAG